MKFEKTGNPGVDRIVPENALEEEALCYLNTHLPIFAGVELNVTNAFMDGYAKALEDQKVWSLTEEANVGNRLRAGADRWKDKA